MDPSETNIQPATATKDGACSSTPTWAGTTRRGSSTGAIWREPQTLHKHGRVSNSPGSFHRRRMPAWKDVSPRRLRRAPMVASPMGGRPGRGVPSHRPPIIGPVARYSIGVRTRQPQPEVPPRFGNVGACDGPREELPTLTHRSPSRLVRNGPSQHVPSEATRYRMRDGGPTNPSRRGSPLQGRFPPTAR